MDKSRLTQVGRAIRELHVEMIAAYSPQARGRSERSFGTWQNRCLRNWGSPGSKTLEHANQFLAERYIAEFNRLFTKPAREKGTAFRQCKRKDLNLVFSVQTGHNVDNVNTVAIRDRYGQLSRTPLRRTLVGCRVIICEHLNGTVSVCWGPHTIEQFDAEGPAVGTKVGARRARMERKQRAA